MTATRFEHVDASRLPGDADLRRQLLDLWVDATNAGGAIGFVAPVTASEASPLLDGALARVTTGVDDLGVLVDTETGRLVGMGFLVASDVSIAEHWRLVARVAVHPEVQGAGLGRQLMDGLHDRARSLGLDHLFLSVRDETGLERFYERCGYRRCGVHPRALRLGADDVRDEIFMVGGVNGRA